MDEKGLKSELNKLQKHIQQECNRISTAFGLTHIAVELKPDANGKVFTLSDNAVKIKVAWQEDLIDG